MAYISVEMHLALIMVYIIVKMHLAPHDFVKTLVMAYIFIETCLALDLDYIPFEMHLGLIMVNIFVRMYCAHNIMLKCFIRNT
jgi:hypothetical protein